MNTQKKVSKSKVSVPNGSDRRKNNYNVFFTSIFIFLFVLIFINKLILINIDDRLDELNAKLDKYFGPIEDVQLPAWEENP
jgi:hypothetical protein